MARPENGYVDENGNKIPGVTTIVKRVAAANTDVLMQWAVNKALEQERAIASMIRQREEFLSIEAGEEVTRLDALIIEAIEAKKAHIAARDYAGRVGTITHDLIESYLRDGKSCSDAYGPELGEAVRKFRGWLKWHASTSLTLVEQEVSLVSKRGFGGTYDALMRDGDGVLWLQDWKSGSNVYEEVMVQLAGYWILLNEKTQHRVDKVGVVNPTINEGFRSYAWDASVLAPFADRFLVGLELYQRDAKLKKIFTAGKEK